MHYAFPTRKPSGRPPAYAIRPPRTLRFSPRTLLVGALAFLSLIYLLVRRPSSAAIPTSTPSDPRTVLVTVLDAQTDAAIESWVRENRQHYARLHGYATFITYAHNYTLNSAPSTWAKVPALRHAQTAFPKATFFLYLDPHVLIMNASLELEAHVMRPARLESLMITDVPVVPPDSVIKTYAGLKGDRIDMVITQDKDGLSEKAFVVRGGEWARFLLDAWFDPLYRSYNFQRAERHALEHIVQWHQTLLAKLALVPQNVLNSYSDKQVNPSGEALGTLYKAGDFIINFGDCDLLNRNCQQEMQPYYMRTVEMRGTNI